MDAAIREAYDAQRRLGDKGFPSGCYAPFVSLLFTTVGNVVACCRNQNYLLGNVARDRLDAIWTGEAIRVLRRNLEAYRFAGGCEFCGWRIAAGDFAGAVTAPFDAFEVPDREPRFPRMMEFYLSNACNFACVHCNGDWSSTIRAQREGMPPLPAAYGDEFFADLRKYLPHLRMAKFFGGEPFLIREHHRVWQMMIEDGLRTPCFILTNGSQWNASVERVLESLPCSIGVSLDGTTKETLERVRVNADFDLVMENFRRFRAYTRERGTEMLVSFSLMRDNWRELGAMVRFAEEEGCHLEVIRVAYPPQHSLFALPAPELLGIVETLEREGRDLLPRLSRLAPAWTTALDALRAGARGGEDEGYRDYLAAESRLALDHPERAGRLLEEGRWEDARAEATKTPPAHKDYVYALHVLAHASRRVGDLPSAEAAIEKALALTRGRAELFVERAWIRDEMGRPAEGLEDARRAQALLVRRAADASSVAHERFVLQVTGRLLARLGKVDEARGIVEKLDGLGADVDWTTLEGARILERAGLAGEALARLERAERRLVGEGDSERSLLLARLLRRAGRMEEASRALDRAFAAEDGANAGVDAHLERAWLRYAEGRFREGLEDARRAEALLEGPPSAARAGRVLQAIGRLLGRLGDAAGVREVVARLDAIRPGDTWIPLEGARLLVDAGLHREALDRLDRIAREVPPPADRELELLRATLLRREGRLDEASHALDRLFALEGDGVDEAGAHLERAWLLHAQGRHEEGLEAARRAEALRGRSAAAGSSSTPESSVLQALGHVLAALEKIEEVREVVARLAAIPLAGARPPLGGIRILLLAGLQGEALEGLERLAREAALEGDREVELLRATLLRRAGRLEEAALALDRALARDGEGGGQLDALLEQAWLRHAQGRFEEGLASASRALSLAGGADAGEVAGIHQALVYLHFGLGRHAEAAQALERYRALRPADPWIEEARRIGRAHRK